MRNNAWQLFSVVAVALMGVGGMAGQFGTSAAGRLMATEPPGSQQPAIAQAPAPKQSRSIKSGQFVSGEHPTRGKVHVVQQNNQLFLELDPQFQTSNMGPDLVVALHRSPNVLNGTTPPAYPLNKGDYVVLAPLQKFSGAQRYRIPANVNVNQYRSAVIWCRRFNATFGAAAFR